MEATVAVSGRVLIVEDEILISMVLGDMLDMLGLEVAGVAASVDEARPLVEAGAFDVAVLDVHLGDTPVFPLADTIAAMGKPIVFATGSGRDGLPERFQGRPLLAKPYALPAVEAALTGIVATAG